jgi:predicted transcriptional regulator
MVSMSLRMADELAGRLRDEAEAEKISVNQAVVTAISDWLAKRADQHAAEAFQAIAVEQAELLDRLGNA